MRIALLAIVALVPVAAARAQNEAEARAHYDKGIVHYNASQWDAAIAEFEKAYELSRAAPLLYNIGQAQRLKGDLRAAIQSYRSYLRLEPTATNRTDVEQRIAEMERALADEAKRKQAEEDRRRAPPPPTPSPAPGGPGHVMRVDAQVMRVEVKGRSGNKTMMRAGLIVAGAGVVAVGVGTYYAVLAARNWDNVQTVDENSGQWNQTHDDEWHDAQRQELTAKLLIGIGGVAVATGGVLYFFGARADSSPQLSVAPAPGGGVVGVAGAF